MRGLLLAAAAVVLVALVAVAAGGYRLDGSGSSHANPYAIDTILTIVIALYIIGAVAVVLAMFWSGLERRRYQRPQATRQRTWRMIAVLLAALALFTIAGERYHLRRHIRPPADNPAAANTPQGRGGKAGHRAAAREPHVRLAPLLAVLGAGGIAFAAFLLAERRRRRRLPRAGLMTETLSDVLDDTLDDLRAEADPRRAVIAAYARMERALAWFGLPRQVFEAPLEYLSRVLLDLRASAESVRRLTGLFERAKFSTQEIGPPLKHEAIEALVAVRDELRGYR